MRIEPAGKQDICAVKMITHSTIKEIYPHYYPKGAVDFFLDHHSDEKIEKDISEGCVFLCFDAEHHAVGTVTVRDNEISRLFVLPRYQGCGYGKELRQHRTTIVRQTRSQIFRQIA